MRILRKCLFLGIALSAMVGCNREHAKAPMFKPPEVLVTGVVEDDITDVEDFTGSLEAYRRVDLQSRVTGYLMKRHFREGSRVAKDQLPLRLGGRPGLGALHHASDRARPRR